MSSKAITISAGILALIAWMFFGVNLAYAAVSFWQKSHSFVPQSTGDFSSDSFKQSLKNFQSTGGNFVTLIIPIYQNDLYSTSIYAGWNTPTDQSLKDATDYAHSLGLKVTFKIHLDTASGQWRADINPGDRNTWFGSYGYWLNRYADLAKLNGAEQLIIGSEMYKMTSRYTNSNNTQNWNKLIAGVRSRYSGSITYSAQRSEDYYNEQGEIGFWDKLDLIGVSAYYALAPGINSPSVDDYFKSWQTIDNQRFWPMYQQYNKPFLMTEIGYRSIDGAHREPWNYSMGGRVNMEEQANLYEALFQYWNSKNYMSGVHLWDWSTSPNAGGPNNTDYTPQHKPAQNVMASWFGGSSGGGTPIPTATPSPTNNPPQNLKVSAGANPGTVGANQNTTISATVSTSNSSSGLVIDVEVFDAAGNKVKQQYFENQTIDQNGKTVSFGWQSGSSGTYRIDVGVFGPNWTPLYLWQYQAGNLTVGNNPTPTPSTQPQSPTPTQSQPSPTMTPQPTSTPGLVNKNINLWWPSDGSSINGTQPFKANIDGMDISQYSMIWQVDGGNHNGMDDSQQDYPHKESWVDVSGWNWNGNGPYNLNFAAKDGNGNTFAQKEIKIRIAR